MKCLALATLVSLTPVIVTAQVARDTARTEPIVITATRSPISADRSPASISVITGEEMRREGITTVLDALRQVPGLSVVQTGSYGGATSLFIRGGESKYAKVLIDGVPANDAGGSFDFSSLTTDNLDRIEIVRGPASVLYGSDAMAGVVQLFTRAGAGKPRIEASGRGGQLGTFDGDVSALGASDVVSYSLAGAQHITQGIQLFNSGFRQSVGSARVGLRHGSGDVQFLARYGDNSYGFPTDGSGQVADSNANRRDDRLSTGIDAGYRFGALTEVRLNLASYDIHGVTDNQPDSPGDKGGYYYTTGDRSYRRSGDLRVTTALTSALNASVGGQIEREWATSSTQSSFGPSQFSARRRTGGVYGQLLFVPIDEASVSLGGRYEHNEKFGDFTTYRAAASTQIVAGTRIRASVGTAFREPTILENFGGAFAIGNQNLTPEHAFSYDAAIEQRIASVGVASVTYFNNSFRDLIDYKYSATLPNYNNIARTKATGVELTGKTDAFNGIQADAAFTYLKANVVDPGVSLASTGTFAPGANLLRRPMHTIDAGLGYRSGVGAIDLRGHHVGVREDVYFAPDFSSKRVTLDPYTRFDLSGEVTVRGAHYHSVTATLRIENLYDAHYTDVAGINYNFAQADDASIARTGYRAAGRRTLVGLRLVL